MASIPSHIKPSEKGRRKRERVRLRSFVRRKETGRRLTLPEPGDDDLDVGVKAGDLLLTTGLFLILLGDVREGLGRWVESISSLDGDGEEKKRVSGRNLFGFRVEGESVRDRGGGRKDKREKEEGAHESTGTEGKRTR